MSRRVHPVQDEGGNFQMTFREKKKDSLIGYGVVRSTIFMHVSSQFHEYIYRPGSGSPQGHTNARDQSPHVIPADAAVLSMFSFFFPPSLDLVGQDWCQHG